MTDLEGVPDFFDEPVMVFTIFSTGFVVAACRPESREDPRIFEECRCFFR
jgi:hypothetical protein